MQRSGTRLTGALLVVLFHVPVVLGLLVLDLAAGIERPAVAPITEVLLPPLPPPPARTSSAPIRGAAQGSASGFVSPDATFAPLASAPGVGALAFGCAPENLKNLTRQEQATCLKLAGEGYAAMREALPRYVKLPGPEWEGLRNSDLRARERNTADPCAIAKMSKMAATECIHEVIYGKTLP